MAGCQMCSGENSVPTWLFHCFDRSILTIDRSPELTAVTPRPSVKNTPDGSTLESRAPTTPVALRPVSARHAPAVVPTPCPQFRKDCWHPQKSRPGRWLRRGQRFFRNWGPGADSQAGAWERDAIRNIAGRIGLIDRDQRREESEPTAPFAVRTVSYGPETNTGIDYGAIANMDISLSVPTGPQNVPQHVWQPAILYLGRPAQV